MTLKTIRGPNSRLLKTIRGSNPQFQGVPNPQDGSADPPMCGSHPQSLQWLTARSPPGASIGVHELKVGVLVVDHQS